RVSTRRSLRYYIGAGEGALGAKVRSRASGTCGRNRTREITRACAKPPHHHPVGIHGHQEVATANWKTTRLANVRCGDRSATPHILVTILELSVCSCRLRRRQRW